MGKVRELLLAWDMTPPEQKDPTHKRMARELWPAMDFDEIAAVKKDVQLEAKDRRIAELEAERDASRGMTRVHAQDVAVLEQRIAELEAEMAKRELPPLLAIERQVVEYIRGANGVFLRQEHVDVLTGFFDTHYPAPVPQWEKDAQYLERKLGGETRSAFSPDEVRAIAARIRESGKKMEGR